MDRKILLKVCDNISDGLAMREACKKAGVSTKTFCQYLHTDKDLSEQYARAKEVRSHDGADRIVSVMDRVEAGELEPDKARIIIDGHKWLIGKWNRRDYGDKTAIVGGDEGDAPVQVKDVTDRDRAKAMLDLMRRAKPKEAES